jgi:erythritol/L-threitol dehydrogenase
MIPAPAPGPGEVLVRVEAVGICASDLKCYHGAAKFWGDDNRPAWAETEVVPGHEFVGTAIRMLESGVLLMDRICTHQLPLSEFQTGLQLVASGA